MVISIFARQGNRPDCPLDAVGIQLDPAVLKEQRQALPVAQGIADRFGQGGAPRDPSQLDREPGMQGVHDRLAALLPDCTPLLGGAAADLGFDDIELAASAQRLFGQGQAGGLVDLVKAPSAVGPTEGEPDRA
jgi:hypothetical protein